MKLKKMFVFIMAILMLAACGNTGGTGAVNNTGVADVTTAAASTTTQQTTTTAASTASSEDTTSTSDSKPGGLPLVEEKATLSVYWPADATILSMITDFNENPTWQIIEEQTNVHIEWFHGTKEQLQMMLNSGDMSDIVFISDLAIYQGGGDKAIEDGAFLRLNELMEQYAPNYMGLLNGNPDLKRDAMSDVGNIVSFAMLEDIVQGPFTGLGIRQDWLDDLGLSKPVTYDDWHTVLTAFKNEKNATAPLTIPADLVRDSGDNGELSGGFGLVAWYYQIDGQIKYGPIEPEFRDYVTLLSQWYSEGLIDPDFNTRDGNGRDQLKYTNQAGAWLNTGFWLLEYHKRNAEDPNYTEVAVSSPVQKPGDIVNFRQSNRNFRGLHTVVTSSAADPVLAVRWLDNLYSEDNYILTNYGIEGQSYTITDDGEYLFTDLIMQNPTMNVGQAMNVYLIHSGPMRRMWWREAAGYTETELDCYNVWESATDKYVIPATTTFTADEGIIFSRIMSDVETYVLETMLAFITGTQSLDTFDAFQEQIKAMNIDEAINIRQASLDRFNNRK